MSKILVVDDEAQNRELLKDFLEAKDYHVTTAGGGKEALEKIKEKPDIVLLDIQMPGMNGLQVLDKIKEVEPSMGVVMVTSMAEQDIAIACIKKGAYDYVTKPIDFNHLETVINVHMIQMSTEEEAVPERETTAADTPPDFEKGDLSQKSDMINKRDTAQGVDKRRCRRFEIPGATGKCKKTGLHVLLKGFSKAYPIVDISKGGLSFTCEETLKKGQKITVQLLAPNEPPLNLRSMIRRVGLSALNKDNMVGVVFMPFGNRSGGNPTEALNVLRRLDEQYGE
ncbi:response regulator [Thermodesulfobacteriota bacterium]